MRKPRVLMFVSQFGQAGAERLAYEIDRSIDRSKIELDILCRFPLKGDGGWEDHYYQLHVENGTNVSFMEPPLLGRVRSSIRYRLFPTALKEATKIDRKLDRTLDRYDAILWMGEYIYNGLGEQISKSVHDKSLIYIMSSKSQTMPLDYYCSYDKSKYYRFVSFLPSEESVRHELSDFPNYEHHFFPLSFAMQGKPNRWGFDPTKKLRTIGIFTRLSQLKPLDPFLYAFHLLIEKIPNLELHIFGSGDPVESGVARYVQNLHLEDKVIFRGHVKDISEAAIEADLDLIWFQSMHGMPGGFAGYDLCLTGIPQVYWEISSSKFSPVEEYPAFVKLSDFVDKSFELLTDKTQAELQSARQFAITADQRDIKNHIGKLEDLLTSIATGKGSN